MKVDYFTNLDITRGCDLDFPQELLARPMKGDRVRASSSLELEVYSIIWRNEGTCLVELHIPRPKFDTVSEFQSWYQQWKR